MRKIAARLLTFLSAFAASFFALTPVAFAASNPNTGDNNMVPLVIGLLVSTPLPEKLWRRIRTSPLGTVLLLVLFWVCVYCMAVATNDPFMYFRF